MTLEYLRHSVVRYYDITPVNGKDKATGQDNKINKQLKILEFEAKATRMYPWRHGNVDIRPHNFPVWLKYHVDCGSATSYEMVVRRIADGRTVCPFPLSVKE